MKQRLEAPELLFLMEVHSGLSARIAAEAGFEALWASGLSMSAAHGVRDNNELTWTEVAEAVRTLVEASALPVLVDGDSGYGNFNSFRRAACRFASVGAAGVCIEDKLFPKTNSFLRSETQPLACPEEFAGRLAAARDALADPDFVLVARTEALIAGHSMQEALDRAHRYVEAGADAILIHSRRTTPDEVLMFRRAWTRPEPVVIVPTRYATTPTSVFREAGFHAVIWANHLLRASLAAMQRTARRIREDESVAGLDADIAPLEEIFRLQNDQELAEAELRYLPAPEDSEAPCDHARSGRSAS